MTRLILFFISALCFCLPGCGDGRLNLVPVSGTVSINGEPLTGYNGFVRVEPADVRGAIGQINSADGTFRLTTYEKEDGCVVGQHPVAVIVNQTVSNQLISIIPEKYSDSTKSGLSVTIAKDTPISIKLEGKLRKAVVDPTMYEGDDPGFEKQ